MSLQTEVEEINFKSNVERAVYEVFNIEFARVWAMIGGSILVMKSIAFFTLQ